MTEVFLTLTEVFPCFLLSCKANARAKLAKTGHGPQSSTLVVFVLFGCYSCYSMYCLCVNMYCHWVTTQLQLINTHIYIYHISYHIISYHIISYHIISYHIISYHIISYNISYNIIYHISYEMEYRGMHHRRQGCTTALLFLIREPAEGRPRHRWII